MKKTAKKMLKEYHEVVQQITEKFAKKQDLVFEFWVADKTGDIACFAGGYFFNFLEILHDLESKIQKGVILEWHDANIEHHPLEIDYFSYTLGIRHSDVK